MPRRCTICDHVEREDIEADLVSGKAFRNIAKQWSVSPSALFRHRDDHLPAHLTKAQAAEKAAQADDLLTKIQQLESDARRIQTRAEKEGDLRTALHGIRELVRIVELLAKVQGELQEGQTVNIILSPAWLAIRSKLIRVLAPYPQARAAIAEVLADDNQHPGR